MKRYYTALDILAMEAARKKSTEELEAEERYLNDFLSATRSVRRYGRRPPRETTYGPKVTSRDFS